MRLAYNVFLAAIALAIAFDILFYQQDGFGLNIFLAELLFLGASFFFARRGAHPVPTAAWVSAGFALAFSATPALWTSTIGLAVSFFGFLFANILFAVFMLGESAAFRHPLDVLSHMTLAPARHALRALPLAKHLRPARLSDRSVRVIKAVIIALPVLFVFTMLLASADPVFGDYITRGLDWIEGWLDVQNVVGHLWYVGFFTVLFGLYLAAAFLDRKPGATFSQALPRGILESKIILGLVIALFAVFLLVQGGMLFGGEATLRALDLTYSEYARQGFTQLSVVGMLVLGLVLTLRVLHGEKVDRALLWLHAALLGETALMVASATIRLRLYTETYGYTPERLFAGWCIGVVGILLVLTFFNVVFQRDQRELMRNGLVFVGIAMFAFTASAPDARAVRLNLARAENGETFDWGNNTRLSPEAWPTLLRAADADITYERDMVVRWDNWVQGKYQRLNDDGAWQRWNLSRVRAARALENVH